MKASVAIAALAFCSASAFPVLADEQSPLRTQPKTTGDSGVLPATAKMGERVKDQGATDPPEYTGRHEMADSGKLPATHIVSGAVPTMATDDPSSK